MPLVLRSIALLPSGLSGPGGIECGILFAQSLPGLTHRGLTRLLTILNVPVGVSKPGAPVATSYVLAICPFSYTYSLFSPSRTRTIDARAEEGTLGWTSRVTSSRSGDRLR